MSQFHKFRKTDKFCPGCNRYFKSSEISRHRKTHIATLAPLSNAIRQFADDKRRGTSK